MASTLILQNSMNFVAPLLKNQPLMVSNQEPALTAGNIVLCTMLGAPLRWRFNRASFSIPVTAGGGTDYAVALSTLGFLETLWIIDGTGKVNALEGEVSLAPNGAQGRPEKLAAQYDDNEGNIIFRLDKTPDKNYTIHGDFQQKAVLMTSAASPWGVVPDEFEYIYQYGFLCLMSLIVNDSRFPIFENYFLGRLLGAQDGLSDQARNIFVGNWMTMAQTVARSQGAVTSGIAGRGK